MEIKKIFVVGAGFMGSGIAQVAIQSGFDVTINDQREAALEGAKVNIEKRLTRLVTKGKITEEDKAIAMSHLSTSSSVHSATDADLVIEAIFENLDAKRAVFEQLDKICGRNTIFASNTSSISLTSLAAATSRADRVVGMHFFSPVPAMRLVEVVYGLRTSQETIDTIMSIGDKMNKKMILAKDKPGFIVNRMLLPMLNEAVQILDEDIGSVEDTDEGMKLGCNHPMGPLELADMVGLDILLEVMETFYTDLGDTKYRPAHLLRKMVAAGYLGQKSGAGFYIYDKDRKKVGVNPVLDKH
ncbi:3-hydroxyacyl-CoA dehydrogenase family protein [Pseudoflavonifractor sp. MSJ-37]|uniref:3-hydroxyacyl-CoA dehydrogenase family protein n=1 Tax=Pseudoflavonifractor sp. MSJ-37 TaxID=2841531 RepID=UPI001C0FEF03|nr:3-hydroxyacyl-CoA dehydrogenase NAD-binding domain-containing protein [Pseudoflavonifractor sp. MSJ-37]MBU5435504.1 3-hydroxybutyryl-CoA dehydrogenase [Pseudoflavonifractor sp. MSJ-37]